MNHEYILENVNFDEAKQSQLAAVEVLLNMGYKYLTREEVLACREGNASRFILKNIAYEKLKEINSYEHDGEVYKFNEKNVKDAIDELDNIQMEGLIDTSKKVYDMIMRTGGKTITEVVNGHKTSQNFRFIDFNNPAANAFHVSVEFEASGKGDIRPDIICFVNGIPFVVIENKKSSVDIKDAVLQMYRNQQPDYCPRLFIYPQHLIAANKNEFLYGTTGTPAKFYAAWKEKSLVREGEADKKQPELDKEARQAVEERVKELIGKPIDNEVYARVLRDLNGATSGHTQVIDRLPAEQDWGLAALLEPARLFELTRNYILYDAGIKKVPRYQQFFAVNKILKQIETEERTKTGLRRKGGIVWHTQGSGKSLTMVMFVKALIEHPKINNPRIIILTDRRDLNKQISDTFKACNLKKKVYSPRNGKDLLKQIKNKSTDVITVLVHKFESARDFRADFSDSDKNIFVLIDEAHRTQGGEANLEMNRTIPNACFIAFTGTPLLKEEKSQKKFGEFIDKYTIDDALADKVILPLVYEGRYAQMTQDRDKIDKKTDRVMDGLKSEHKRILQGKVSDAIIRNNPNRITEIAYNIEKHFIENFQGTGLKGQVVAPSKFSAVLFQEYFGKSGKLKTAVVISDIGSKKEDEEDDHRKPVIDFLKQKKHEYSSLESYEKRVIDSFKNDPEDTELIIVVDKLLTGFDAPRNTVLYLAKDLRDHNLLQAIARVNRLFESKKTPKTSGFIIDYSENAKNLDTAMKLFGNYDDDDVKSALIDVKEKVKELEDGYDKLHEIFKDLKGSRDDEAYIQKLKDDPERDLFYKAVNNFIKLFNECLALREFAHEFKDLDVYKKELKKFDNLRKTVRLRYADSIDFTEYKNRLVKILDQYVDAESVEVMTGQININDKEAFDRAIATLGSNKSKAEAIAAHTQKTIHEKIHTDPEFYRRFSDKIDELLKKLHQRKLEDLEALKQMKAISAKVINKEDELIPAAIKKNKGADIFYRNLEGEFKKCGIEGEAYVRVIVSIFNLLKKEAIVDWYRNGEVKRIIANRIDDYIYDEIVTGQGIKIANEDIKKIIDAVIELAVFNHEVI